MGLLAQLGVHCHSLALGVPGGHDRLPATVRAVCPGRNQPGKLSRCGHLRSRDAGVSDRDHARNLRRLLHRRVHSARPLPKGHLTAAGDLRPS